MVLKELLEDYVYKGYNDPEEYADYILQLLIDNQETIAQMKAELDIIQMATLCKDPVVREWIEMRSDKLAKYPVNKPIETVKAMEEYVSKLPKEQRDPNNDGLFNLRKGEKIQWK